MILGKPKDDYESFDDVNSDIHKEYNVLVFKYAALLSSYLNVSRELEHKIDELTNLKEELKSERVKYGTVPLPKMWK